MQDNENIDIQELMDKYENMLLNGKMIYFDADEFAALADYYLSMDDYTFADNIIDDGLKIHPESSALIVLKAKVMVSLELYEEALEYINSISENEDIEFVVLKIEVLFHTGNTDDASTLVKDTIDRDLSIEDLYVFITELGYILNDITDYDRAIYFLEQSLKIDSSNEEVYVDLSYAYEMKSNFKKAIENTNLLLDINPYSYDGWINLGKLYSLDEQFDKSISAFEFACTIKEGDISAKKMKALAMFLNNNTEEAIKLFKECIMSNPDDKPIYDSIIQGYEDLEEYDYMIEFINLKEERFGEEGIALKRAYVEMQRGNLPNAWNYLNQVPESEKESYEYFMLEGDLFFVSDNMRESEVSFFKAMLITENKIDVFDKLANVSVAQNKHEQAAEYLEQVLASDPEYPGAKIRLAFVRFELGAKEPFDKIMAQFTDEEIRKMLIIISGDEKYEYIKFPREEMLIRLNIEREKRILFKNFKY